MTSKIIVIDANILIRAVLGIRIDYKDEASNRINERDEKDWPIVALSLALECPIWTEDQDFFGTGIATWRTKNIEIFFRGDAS